MRLIALFFGWIAVVIHILFFCLESLLWLSPKTMSLFKQTLEQAQTTKLLAFNQGFYNLFLAMGLAAGLILWIKKKNSGKTLIIYTCSFMIGAALVLLCSSPQMIKGVVIQGAAPLLALIFFSIQKDV